jgi:hypothetical protein
MIKVGLQYMKLASTISDDYSLSLIVNVACTVQLFYSKLFNIMDVPKQVGRLDFPSSILNILNTWISRKIFLHPTEYEIKRVNYIYKSAYIFIFFSNTNLFRSKFSVFTYCHCNFIFECYIL